MTAEPKKKSKSLVLIIVGGLVLLCIVCGIFGAISSSTPEATATARAIEHATEAAKPTATPDPTNTPLSTKTPLLTSTPLCFLPSGALIGLGAGLWYREKARKRHQQELEKLKTSHQQELENFKTSYQRSLATLTAAKLAELEELQVKTWLKVLKKPTWKDKVPEVEVETKFVFPLLRYLGYEDSDMAMRVPVRMQEGSSKITREADWVIRDKDGNALIVVEAKAPGMSLSEAVAKQARSYAFRLGAPVYITTNGKEIQVFHRGIIEDRCVLSCTTSQLSENWTAIQGAAGKSNVITLRNQLTGVERHNFAR